MATKKDLVEAHAFSRRRLVTAFLSGAPGGREVEPHRPGRTIVGGLALSVLLVAGAAIASVLASRTEEDWNSPGLVVAQQSVTPYLILEKEDPPLLIPLANITSAQLILGADLDPRFVDQDTITEQRKGDYVGILGAPPELPGTDALIQTGWTACTADDRGVAVEVTQQPEVTGAPDDGAFLVENDGALFVIALSSKGDEGQRAYRYPVPDETVKDTMLAELGLGPRASAVSVPTAWLDLFPSGGTLDWESFGITGYGKDAPGGGTIGTYVVDDDGGGVVVTRQGLARLDPFALAVYSHSLVPRTRALPEELPEGTTLPDVDTLDTVYADAHWPDQVLQDVPGDLCAQLLPQAGELPRVVLATDAEGLASADDIDNAAAVDPTVDAGHGAYVSSGSWDQATSASPYVLTSQGDMFPLQGRTTLVNLGYADRDAPVVPDSWIELFGDDVVPLSSARALCPAVPQPAPDTDCLG